MARPTSNIGGGEPSHYEVLAITPGHLEGQAAPSQAKVVKKAYHRALLRHHPDKASAGYSSNGNVNGKSPANKTPSSSSSAVATFTVDQIQEAYAVLSDSRRRGEYDRQQQQRRQQQQQQQGTTPFPAPATATGGATTTTTTWSFRTGVETVDLDDLGFDERTGVYFRSCRCGNPRGYRFEDDDLAACEDDGVLVVGCADCSLWLRVLFAPAGDDEGEDGAAAETQQQQQQMQTQAGTREVVGAGGAAGKGFRFNWSFSLGISVGGSLSASAGPATSSRS